VLPPDQIWSTNLRNNIYRVGLNYRFGDAGAIVRPAAANWAGFYVGGNIGVGVAQNEMSTATSPFPGVVYMERGNLAPRGWTGGVLAGHNWQNANWVYGVETDFQFAGQRDNQTCVMVCNI